MKRHTGAMYGMVNKAVEDLICGQFGEDTWEKIRQKAGVEDEVFVSNEAYPDELTYRLVGAASETLNLPAEKVLHVFGEHWILQTAREGYGHLMEAAGDNLRDFLINLPNFHTRVVMIMPKLEPPHFRVTDVTESSLRLHYHTHREGLAPFMLGLLSGLAKMFETEIEVDHDVVRGEGADHDEFLVHWK